MPSKPAPASDDVAGLVAAAVDALARSRQEPALRFLLDAWRATRSPRLATAIDRVGRQIKRRPIGGTSLKTRNARWTEVADARDPLDVPRLLAVLHSNRAQAATRRLEILAEFPDDPRIAIALATFLVHPPYDDGTAMAESSEIATEQLVRIADERVVPILEPGGGVHLALVAAIRAAVEHTARPIPATALEACARLDELLASVRSGEELLAAIQAAPDDDGPRAVYADWLLEQGDLHGELINLQLAAAHAPPTTEAAAREAELVTKLDRRLLGSISKVVTAPRFARGFPVACAIETPNRRTMIAASTALEWLTIEEIDHATSLFVPATTYTLPSFRNLKRLRRATPDVVRALVDCAHPPDLELLGLYTHVPVALVSLVEACVRFPALTRLELELAIPPEVLAHVWRGSLGRQLAHLRFGVALVDLAGWLSALAPSAICELVAGFQPSTTARRTSPGDPWHLVLPRFEWDDAWEERLADLAALGPDLLARVTIAATTAEATTTIEALLADRLAWA